MDKLGNWIRVLVSILLISVVPIKSVYTNMGKYFAIESGKQFSNAENIIIAKVERSQIKCVARCKSEQLCCTASFDKADSLCKLSSNCAPSVAVLSSSVVIRLKQDECRRTAVGYEYDGHRNVTPGNNQCQRWDTNSPHVHMHQYISHEENYCRNPDRDSGGPWCYTVDPNKRFEYCNIPFCARPPQECVESPTGSKYFGVVSQTKSGLTCQRWDTLYPHIHTYQYLSDQKNYCRNPFGTEQRPWCYTTNLNVRWEICDVKNC